MSRAGARTCFAALAARSCFVNSVNKTRQLTKHDLLEKGQKEGCGTAGLAAGVTSIAVAKEDVALSEYRRFTQLAAAWFSCASCNARTPC